MSASMEVVLQRPSCPHHDHEAEHAGVPARSPPSKEPGAPEDLESYALTLRSLLEDSSVEKRPELVKNWKKYCATQEVPRRKSSRRSTSEASSGSEGIHDGAAGSLSDSLVTPVPRRSLSPPHQVTLIASFTIPFTRFALTSCSGKQGSVMGAKMRTGAQATSLPGAAVEAATEASTGETHVGEKRSEPETPRAPAPPGRRIRRSATGVAIRAGPPGASTSSRALPQASGRSGDASVRVRPLGWRKPGWLCLVSAKHTTLLEALEN